MPAAGVDMACVCRTIAENAAAVVDVCWVQVTRLDAGRGEVCPVADSGVHDRAFDLAVSAIRRFVPRFDPAEVTFPATANPLTRAVYVECRPVSCSLAELVQGIVDPCVWRIAGGVVGQVHVLACPLHVADRVFGALTFCSARPLTARQRGVGEAFVGQATLALENFHLTDAFHRQLQEVRRSRQLIAAAEERVRGEIAERLHSRVQTRLLVAWHRLGQCRELVESQPLAARALLDELRDELDGIREQEIRQLSHRLHPSIIRVGLVPAVNSLIRDHEHRFRVRLQVDPRLAALDDPVSNRIAEPVRLAAYRIVQEALGNVWRHAAAENVTVSLELVPGPQVGVLVGDDGRGFATTDLSPGLGLSSIATYVDQTGGSWSIASTPGTGTLLAANLPLADGGIAEASLSAREAEL